MTPNIVLTSTGIILLLHGLLFLFGAFIETIQFVLPYRNAELLDLLANLLGIFIAIVVANLGYFGWLLKLEMLIKPRS